MEGRHGSQKIPPVDLLSLVVAAAIVTVVVAFLGFVTFGGMAAGMSNLPSRW